jgi:PAS domain-containing protein
MPTGQDFSSRLCSRCGLAVAGARHSDRLIVPLRLRDAQRRIAHNLASGEGPVLGRLIELLALRADGAEFPVELSIVPILIQGPRLFTGFVRDITDWKRVEQRLHEALRLASVACEAGRMGAWHLDVESRSRFRRAGSTSAGRSMMRRPPAVSAFK